jgi:hypothetical protein
VTGPSSVSQFEDWYYTFAGPAMLSIAFCATTYLAHAEGKISGTPELVRIEATNATVDELLSGLRDKFGLSYRSGRLLDEKIEGAYSGSLIGVVRRLLANYNYVLSRRSDGDTLLVQVLDKDTSPLQPSNKSPSLARRGVAQPPQVASPANQNIKNGHDDRNNIAPNQSTSAANTLSAADSGAPSESSDSASALQALVRALNRVGH